MKKILSIIIAIGCMTAFFACSDDDISNPYAVEKAIKVVKSDVLFPARASEGSVTVEAKNGITKVVNNASWVTYTVNGSTVNVSVSQNDLFQGRTSRLSIYSGEDSTYVVIQQDGIDFVLSAGSEIITNDDAQNLSFFMRHNMPVEILQAEDWFTVSVEGDSLYISTQPNNTGKYRHGYLKYQIGPIIDSLMVTQKDFEKDVLGDYRIVYYSSSKWVYTTGTLERTDNGGFQLRFTGSTYAQRGIILPVELNENALTVTIPNLTEMSGTYTNNGVDYSLIGLTTYTNGSSIYRSSNASYGLEGKFSENEDGTFTWDFDINDAFNRNTYSYYGFRIGYTTGGYSGYGGSYVLFAYMYWEKV